MLVPTYASKARIIFRDSKIEDFVAMGAVALDKARLGHGGVGFKRVIEMDGAVGRAGEDLCRDRISQWPDTKKGGRMVEDTHVLTEAFRKLNRMDWPCNGVSVCRRPGYGLVGKYQNAP